MQIANGKESHLPIYDELCDPRIHGEGYRQMILKVYEEAKPKLIMTKREIREDVNRIIKEYPGEDMSHLLTVIKERIEKKLNEEK